MNKRSICKEVSQKIHIPLESVENSIDSFLFLLKEKIAKGDSIQIRGFGTFSRIYKKPRKVWDPAQKKVKFTNEHFKVAFKPGKEWTELASSQLSQKRKGD